MEIFQFAEFEVNTVSRTVKRGDETLPLNRRAFDVLVCLLRDPGKVLSKEELLRSVWSDTYVDESSLVQSISTLRKALAAKPGESAYIVTLPGRGYQFAYPVRLVSPTRSRAAAGLQNGHVNETDGLLYQEQKVRTTVVTEEQEATRVSASGRRTGWVLAGATVSLGAIALASVLTWRHYHRLPADPIVVLSQMENSTGDPGLTDVLNTAIASDLKQSPYLNFLSPVHVQETLTQMQQKKDSPLTPSLAREVCLRNNAQITLRGVIAKLGQKYLLTVDATDCVSGNSLAISKAEAGTADEIPNAIDTVAANIRKKLGESRASIQKFNTPLVHENTGSLEALRDYSAGRRLALQGRHADAIPLFQRAIDLDPKFAVAYADMAATYGNSNNRAQLIANLTKAYALRDFADERNRLFIIASYHKNVTGNTEEALRNFRNWEDLYPGDLSALDNAADIYTQLGQPEKSIPLARKALERNPDNATAYVILCRALLHAGQLEDARSVGDQAIAKHIDGADLHSVLMEVDVARDDTAGAAAQIAWARNHSAAVRAELNEALLAFAEGRVRQGQRIISELATSFEQQGASQQYAIYQLSSSRILVETGHMNEARALLQSRDIPEGLIDPLVALAYLGETERAQRILTQELARRPEDTLWNNFKNPQIRAAIFLNQHRPLEAIESLRNSAPYELRTLEIPYMRGVAYLEANQPTAAEKEFRKVIDHRGVDPLSHLYRLAHLQLGRALAKEGKRAESRAACERFIALWKDADQDEPLLKQAHEELRRINLPEQ